MLLAVGSGCDVLMTSKQGVRLVDQHVECILFAVHALVCSSARLCAIVCGSLDSGYVIGCAVPYVRRLLCFEVMHSRIPTQSGSGAGMGVTFLAV